MVKNKQGWLRILESTIAVLIILSAFIILYNVQKIDVKSEPTDQISSVMNFISMNDTLRNEILENSTNTIDKIKIVINDNINLNTINYSLKICNSQEICDLDFNEINKKNNIYISEKVITTNLTLNGLEQSKRLKVFYWEIN